MSWILYDGECPFCSAYIRHVRLRKNLNVHLIDAREDSALRKEMTATGYDLDRGMIVKYGGTIYYADAAMVMLSLLSTQSDFFNKTMALVFRSSTRAKYFYPALSLFRRMTVLALGRGKIKNLAR